jgi:hypothetical protein
MDGDRPKPGNRFVKLHANGGITVPADAALPAAPATYRIPRPINANQQTPFSQPAA